MTKLTDENINTILDNITPEIGTILADKLRGAFQNQADEIEILTGIIKANGFKDKFNKALAATEVTGAAK